MRQPRLSEEKDKRAPLRLLISLATAGGVHLALFALFQSYPLDAFAVKTDPISVEIVTLASISPPVIEPAPAPAPAPPPIESPIVSIAPESIPEPVPEPKLAPVPTPIAEPEVVIAPPPAPLPPAPEPTPDIQPPEGQSSQPVQAAPTPQGEVLIPDRWRLPVGARISLDKIGPAKGTLSEALDCLKGFRADCANQRKSVFAADQLSETDLVWMASHPHSGLSDSSLFGLSEAEIRERLAIPTAGQNGFAILPGIAIDGPLWDLFHGVNKACDYSIGVGASGQRELKKRCDSGRPSSRDEIAFKPLVE